MHDNRQAAFIAAARDPVVRMLRHRLIHQCGSDEKRAAFQTFQLEIAMANALQKQGMCASSARNLGYDYSQEIAEAREMLRRFGCSEQE
jgi:hypothetical protein